MLVKMPLLEIIISSLVEMQKGATNTSCSIAIGAFAAKCRNSF